MTHHPIRDLPILVYTGDTDAVAFIGDGVAYSFPYFRAVTPVAAREKAEAFVAQVLRDHEEKYVRLQETLAANRDKRGRKEKPDGGGIFE